MKTLVCVVVSLILYSGLVELRKVEDLAYFAIKIILNDHIATETGKIDFLSCNEQEKSSEKLFNRLLRHKSESMSVRIASCDAERIKLNTSTFLSFDSVESFNQRVEKIDWQTDKYRRHKHLVHFANATADEVARNIRDG